MSQAPTDALPQIKHLGDMDWEMNRFGSLCKFLSPERGRTDAAECRCLRYEAGEGLSSPP